MPYDDRGRAELEAEAGHVSWSWQVHTYYDVNLQRGEQSGYSVRHGRCLRAHQFEPVDCEDC